MLSHTGCGFTGAQVNTEAYIHRYIHIHIHEEHILTHKFQKSIVKIKSKKKRNHETKIPYLKIRKTTGQSRKKGRSEDAPSACDRCCAETRRWKMP